MGLGADFSHSCSRSPTENFLRDHPLPLNSKSLLSCFPPSLILYLLLVSQTSKHFPDFLCCMVIIIADTQMRISSYLAYFSEMQFLNVFRERELCGWITIKSFNIFGWTTSPILPRGEKLAFRTLIHELA